jgi:hypothetical protein
MIKIVPFKANICIFLLTTVFGCGMRSIPLEPDGSPIETDLSERDGVYAYSVSESFEGFAGAIVIDNGQALSVDALGSNGILSIRTWILPSSTRRRLATLFNENDFFRFPDHLHARDCYDGSEAGLYAATRLKSQVSTNYMDPSPTYHLVYDEFTKLAPLNSGTKIPWTVMESVLDDYLKRLDKDDKRKEIVRTWLGLVDRNIHPHSDQLSTQ